MREFSSFCFLDIGYHIAVNRLSLFTWRCGLSDPLDARLGILLFEARIVSAETDLGCSIKILSESLSGLLDTYTHFRISSPQSELGSYPPHSNAREGGTTGRVATCVWGLSGARWQLGRPLSVPYKSMRHDFPIPLGQTHDKWDLWRMMACGYVTCNNV